MKISLVGAIHQQYPDSEIVELVGKIRSAISDSANILEIERRFYNHLSTMGCPLAGTHIMPSATEQIDTDLLISMGGDGTFLRASKLVAGSRAPILGINTGSLGFLANVQPEEFEDVFQQFLDGTAEYEERTMLDAFIRESGKDEVYMGSVLNEVALLKRDTARMITVNTYIDDDFVAGYDGDGLLVATPTGSTAYTLSVGGPIISPATSSITLCAIAPHTLNMRPLVVPEGVEVRMEVQSRTGNFSLACDGKATTHRLGEDVIVRLSDKRLRVLHSREYSYFTTLRNKLMWGHNVRKSAR
ncbi:MAG: NAD(+)/NADH kinase [Porphyromonas sp.]|nr:NAD(+)/NADH kinase [Porphyromonas sp.]